jgi:two-component system response regulator PilR (NtrC family)
VDVPVERSKRPNAGAFEHGNGNGNGHGNGVPSLTNDGLDLEAYIEGLERGLIQSALKQSNGVQTRAAELLHVSYRSFRHLLKKYEI